MRLTGKYYHKQTWFGLILMVQVEYGDFDYELRMGVTNKKYIKANQQHITELKLYYNGK